MFYREHHQRIAQVLSQLDGQFLRENSCYFGGGTAIALRFGEYRESVDIDFITSNVDHYRNIRWLIRESDSLKPVLRNKKQSLPLTSDIRSDQYGIRTRLLVDNVPIKFEIILEGRIKLDEPTEKDRIDDIATLALHDLAATKMLANSDRGMDISTFNRDLIDLAMMNLPILTLRLGLQKAEEAYGASILRDLKEVLEIIEAKPRQLEESMRKMGMVEPQVKVWQRIRRLKKLFD